MDWIDQVRQKCVAAQIGRAPVSIAGIFGVAMSATAALFTGRSRRLVNLLKPQARDLAVFVEIEVCVHNRVFEGGAIA